MKEFPKVIEGAHYGSKERYGSHAERLNALKEKIRAARFLYKDIVAGKIEEGDISPEDIKTVKQYACFDKSGLSEQEVVESFRYHISAAGAAASELRRYRGGDKEHKKRITLAAGSLWDKIGEEKSGRVKMELKKKNPRADMADVLLETRYAVARGKVKKMLDDFGPILEYYHRKTLEREKPYYREFLPALKNVAREGALIESLRPLDQAKQSEFKETKEKLLQEGADAGETRRALSRIALDTAYLSANDIGEILDEPDTLAVLADYAKESGGGDVVAFAEGLMKISAEESGEEKNIHLQSRKSSMETLRAARERVNGLWQDDTVRNVAYREWMNKLVAQDIAGETALETPSILKVMNDIHTFEMRQGGSTPIAAVLIGSPGTGKSVLAEQYLRTHPDHKDKPAPVVFDVSKETSSIMLLGSEEIDIADKASTMRMIEGIFARKKDYKDRLLSGKGEGADMEGMKRELADADTHISDIVVAAMAHHVEMRMRAGKITDKGLNDAEAQKAGDEMLELARKEKLPKDIIDALEEQVHDAIVDWQAKELGKIMFGNGWRMGVILRALSEGRDIIINEFDNFTNPPDELRELMQRPYGSDWAYEEQGKTYKVLSKFILTANQGLSGKKFSYQTNDLTAPIVNRLPPAIEMNDLPVKEEMMIAQAKLSNGAGVFLLQKDVQSPLASTEALRDMEMNLSINEGTLVAYLLMDTVPKLRALADKYPQDVPPITLRNLNFFCRELVNVNGASRVRTIESVENAFVKYYLKPFRMTTEAWNAITQEGIIIDLYRAGILHTPEHKMLVLEALAKQKEKVIDGIDAEARKQVLTDLEKELQQYDQALIDAAENASGSSWKEIVAEARKKKKLVIANPQLDNFKIPSTFGVSDTPVGRAF